MPEFYRIRPVQEGDAEALSELYKRLDSCNASPETAAENIASSIQSLGSGPFERITLVTEHVRAESVQIVNTGSLIRVNSSESNGSNGSKLNTTPRPPNPDEIVPIPPRTHPPTMMYKEVTGGIQLVPFRTNAIEFAAVATLKAWEGKGIGKAMTAIRALIARRFSGLLGVDQVLVEFLPQYEEGTTINSFWTDLIYRNLKEVGTLNALKAFCSKKIGREITDDSELVTVLAAKLSTADRNIAINNFFPSFIPGSNISAAARKVSLNTGKETTGALINLGRVYGENQIERVGNFAVDGGLNYLAETQHGSTGERTVPVEFADGSVEDEIIMRDSGETALVYEPVTDTRRGLRNLVAIVTPGIFYNRGAKLPLEIKALLKAEVGDELTYLKLPRSSGRHKR